MARLVLAATLSSNYGIYGPAFELFENTPREPGSEEYLNSEKYEIKRWDISRAGSLKDLIGRVNRARRENPALQRNQPVVQRHQQRPSDMPAAPRRPISFSLLTWTRTIRNRGRWRAAAGLGLDRSSRMKCDL
jgi:hypothetical protein